MEHTIAGSWYGPHLLFHEAVAMAFNAAPPGPTCEEAQSSHVERIGAGDLAYWSAFGPVRSSDRD